MSVENTLAMIACNNPMAPPLELKRANSLGVYSSSMDMNLGSRCTRVIL